MSGFYYDLNIRMDDNKLTITDLSALRDIIDVACSRGAFRANEMTTVGAIYTKLESFLEQVVHKAGEELHASQQGESND